MAKVDKNLRRVSAEGYFFGSRMSRKTLSTAKNTAGEEVSIAFTLLNSSGMVTMTIIFWEYFKNKEKM